MLKLSYISWQTKLITVLSLCAICFALGWRVHGWKTDAGVTHTIAKQEKTRQNVQKNIDPIVDKKQGDILKTEIVYRTIREKINEADDQRICFADTNAWSLYNSAITGTPPPGSESSGKTARIDTTKRESSGPGQNEQIVATVEQVLNNATDNYETCRKNSVKHNALIDAVIAVQDKLCACSD